MIFLSSEVELVSLQDLVCLFDVYLTPLQEETFLSKDEVNTETFTPTKRQAVVGVSDRGVSSSDGGVVRQSA